MQRTVLELVGSFGIQSLVKHTCYLFQIQLLHYFQTLIEDFVHCGHLCCWGIYSWPIPNIVLNNTDIVACPDVETNPRTGLLVIHMCLPHQRLYLIFYLSFVNNLFIV